MPQSIKKIFSNGLVIAVIMVSLTALLTFGWIIPRLGYYHDDWFMLWSSVSRGPGSLVSVFSSDRPFMGLIYSRIYRVLRENILAWHFASLAIRIAGAAAFYWILSLTWPKLKNLFVLSALLFITFPGYLSQPNAATKINHLIGYGSALFSIALTLQAAVTTRKFLKIACVGLSMVSMTLYLWIYEYMLGLEVMRVVLLFWVYRQESRDKVLTSLKKTFLAYLPYLPVLAIFLYWRMVIFDSTRNATDLSGLMASYQSDFVNMALRLIFQALNDFFSVTILAWFVQPYHLLARADYGRILTALLTATGAVLLALGYTAASRKADPVDHESSSPLPLFLVGSLITLGAVFPVVLSNRYLDLMDSYKSYGLHPSAGVILIVLGFVMSIKPKFRNTALITLLTLSVTAQSLNVQNWAYHWDLQRNYWWQMTWRAPGIRDNTLVMALAPQGYGFQQDYEVWGPLNLIYHQEPMIAPLIHSEVLNEDTALLVMEGKSFPTLYVRSIFLPRDYKNLLLVSQPTPQSCIHVIDGKMPAYSASEHLIAEKVGRYSNIDLIDPLAASPMPPEAIFGQEPEHGWCYYYQQAALSRQTGNWTRIGELYDTVISMGLEPADTSEYFVFIEGLVNLGRNDEAKSIADSHINENDALQYSLCQSLKSAPQYPQSYGYHKDQINQILCQSSKQ